MSGWWWHFSPDQIFTNVLLLFELLVTVVKIEANITICLYIAIFEIFFRGQIWLVILIPL